jgi:murein DD-endopeptidase MepM/ murein hydrolase activator NlpD
MQLGSEDRRPRRALPSLVILLVAVALVVVGLALLRVGPPPVVDIKPQRPAIGRKTPITIDVRVPGRGLGAITVELVQGGTAHKLAERSFLPRPFWAFWGARTNETQLEVAPGSESLSDLHTGDAVLRVTAASAGSFLKHPEPVVAEKTLPVRLQPPALQVLSSRTYVAQGGAEAVVYRVGDGAATDGVRAGDWFFHGYVLPGGDAHVHFALFAVPYDMSDASGVRLVVEDDAGNQSQATFIEQFTPHPFGTDTIHLEDAFLQRVVPAIMSETPSVKDKGNLLDNYLEINGELRRANGQALRELAAKSRPEFLWHETFLPLPNGKVMSHFADRRTYEYQGKAVDHQDHLGFDLASVQHAPVPAGNRGVVVLARFFGIYGNTVVLDHGYGLMSLYAHLSSIGVSEGQTVERGAILGQSGATGLAGGDHLHYTTLLQGLPTNPVEWWDAHWLQDRLKNKLGAALPFAGGPAATTPAPAEPRHAAVGRVHPRPRHHGHP